MKKTRSQGNQAIIHHPFTVRWGPIMDALLRIFSGVVLAYAGIVLAESPFSKGMLAMVGGILIMDGTIRIHDRLS